MPNSSPDETRARKRLFAATDRESALWLQGWSEGRRYTREYLNLFYPWAQLRRELQRLIKEPSLNQAERSAYRQALRMMVERQNRERKTARRIQAHAD